MFAEWQHHVRVARWFLVLDSNLGFSDGTAMFSTPRKFRMKHFEIEFPELTVFLSLVRTIAISFECRFLLKLFFHVNSHYTIPLHYRGAFSLILKGNGHKFIFIVISAAD